MNSARRQFMVVGPPGRPRESALLESRSPPLFFHCSRAISFLSASEASNVLASVIKIATRRVVTMAEIATGFLHQQTPGRPVIEQALILGQALQVLLPNTTISPHPQISRGLQILAGSRQFAQDMRRARSGLDRWSGSTRVISSAANSPNWRYRRDHGGDA